MAVNKLTRLSFPSSIFCILPIHIASIINDNVIILNCLYLRKNIFLWMITWPLLLLLLSYVSRVRLCATHRRQPTRLPRPWDSPGKNTGVGRHFLLQCMKVKSESASLSRVRLFAWTAAYQAPPSVGFSRQEYWSGVPLPSRFMTTLVL